MADPALDIARERARSLPAVFHRYRSAIGVALRESIADDSLSAHQMLRYSMGWTDVDGNDHAATEGKALRPTLCLLACEATGGSARTALPAAVSLELIHNFSLIHDDIQDRDETRHHRSTLWAIWGEPKALVAGNVLKIIADIALWGLLGEDVPHREALRVAGLLTEAYLEMIEGQYLDLSYEGRHDIGMADYLSMISKKTGALIRCSITLGALIGSHDVSTVRAFRECGQSLGFVFQIIDDVLGIWGDEQATGKPVGADIRRKKNSLPIVYAMSRAQGKDKNRLLSIYGGSSIDERQVDLVLEIMDSLGTREFARSLAADYRDKALESLSRVELAPDDLEDIRDVSAFLLERQY